MLHDDSFTFGCMVDSQIELQEGEDSQVAFQSHMITSILTEIIRMKIKQYGCIILRMKTTSRPEENKLYLKQSQMTGIILIPF